ncbi:MAG: hypothetical protein KatS3mg114_0298 [Planctomycetaceae bacterium]|nr:MAG: hypothetical protein KatS3mg114_0298 [Planctomycetaceae bacterium]
MLYLPFPQSFRFLFSATRNLGGADHGGFHQRAIGVAAWLGCVFMAAHLWAQTNKEAPSNPFPNRVPAQEIDGVGEWLNTAGPISLKDLRGKVVLLDFWTYCCINCMHILPDLKYLERKYERELVVIGVHSAKFQNEKDTQNIRQAILRYEIEHPVINDAGMVLWTKYGVRAWPTLVLIDPEGFYCGFVSGEGHRDLLDKVIERVVAYHRAKGTLDTTPLRFDLERQRQIATPLRFPGKVLADEARGWLFITDSNHNRIVITDLDGQVLHVIGSGLVGRADGTYAQAQFDHPQGLALVENTLYVADTENHLLRQVDLVQQRVSTLAGTGEQGYERRGRYPLQEAALNSPWDLVHLDGVLYICMAGPHQIWSHQLGSSHIQVYAGSGREDVRNGNLSEAALAQPSGITTDGRFLYVCDSEGSAIRKISTRPGNNLLRPVGEVATVVGTSNLPNGRSLFEFGDVDGVGAQARLQHPLGITYHDGRLYVADTYNHKIKTIDLNTQRCQTWLGTGQRGEALDPPQFSEPGGVSIARGKLFVADTNNHRICRIDLQTKQVEVLKLNGLQPPASTASQPVEPITSEGAQTLPAFTAVAGKPCRVEIELELPPDHKLETEAQAVFRLQADDPSLFSPDTLGTRHPVTIQGSTLLCEIPLAARTGMTQVLLSVHYQYCRTGNRAVCKLGELRYQFPLQIVAEGEPRALKIQARVAGREP